MRSQYFVSQSSKDFWMMFEFFFIFSTLTKYFPLLNVFSFEMRKKSAGTKPGKYGSWGRITVWFLSKTHSQAAICKQVRYHKGKSMTFFHNPLRLWRLDLRKRGITSRKYSLLTVRPCSKSSWCTTSFQSKKTVSKVFRFDWTWHAIFGLGSSRRFHWIDWAFATMS